MVTMVTHHHLSSNMAEREVTNHMIFLEIEKKNYHYATKETDLDTIDTIEMKLYTCTVFL